jgi:anti-sigma B factor antagonist
MTIKERQFGNIAVLDLFGPITGRKASDTIEAMVRGYARAGTRTLIANLGEVPSVDLGGLGALVEGCRVMREAGGVLSLACVTRRIHDLIVITRLLTVFDTFDSVEEALGGMVRIPVTTSPAVSPFALGAIHRFRHRV